MEKHESLTVSRVDSGSVIACSARGEERSFTPAQTRSFSVHERQSIEVAPGDRLMLTANRRDTGFRATNGELVQVCDIENGRINLEDGRGLSAAKSHS
jgi:hypothetical protein